MASPWDPSQEAALEGAGITAAGPLLISTGFRWRKEPLVFRSLYLPLCLYVNTLEGAVNRRYNDRVLAFIGRRL